jgi:medium-chain acyl-[acyl-carrier-protein] hydrolase
MLPTLRADLAIVDNYRCVDAMPLPYPISVHCGDHDPDFGPGQAHEWQRHTAAGFQITVHAGGHFFPVHRPAPVVAGIEHALLAPAGDAR